MRFLMLLAASAALFAFGSNVWGGGPSDLNSLEGQCLNVEGGGGARLFGGCAPTCTIPTTPAGGGGAPVALFNLKGHGAAFGKTIVNGIEFDAIAGSVGGVASGGPGEQVGSGCVFTTGNATDIADNHIEVETASYPDTPAACVDPEKCIQCLNTSVGDTCFFDCTGKVPANQTADADSFEITITMTHSFVTDTPRPPGMIRFDGFADQWAEFLPEGAIPIFVTTDGCNGGAPDEMVLNNLDPLGIDSIVADTSWGESFGIDDQSLGGHCSITTILKASMPLKGVAAGGEVDVTRGGIIEYGAICNKDKTADDCPPPAHP